MSELNTPAPQLTLNPLPEEPAPPVRADGVDDAFGGERKGGRGRRIAPSDLPDLPSFRQQQVSACRFVDGGVNTGPDHRPRIGGVDDRVRFHIDDIVSYNPKRHTCLPSRKTQRFLSLCLPGFREHALIDFCIFCRERTQDDQQIVLPAPFRQIPADHPDRDLCRAFFGIPVHAGADRRERNAPAAVFFGQFQAVPVAGSKQILFTAVGDVDDFSVVSLMLTATEGLKPDMAVKEVGALHDGDTFLLQTGIPDVAARYGVTYTIGDRTVTLAITDSGRDGSVYLTEL